MLKGSLIMFSYCKNISLLQFNSKNEIAIVDGLRNLPVLLKPERTRSFLAEKKSFWQDISFAYMVSN